MSTTTVRLGFLFSGLLIAFSIFQLSSYHQYAFEVTWLYAKEMLGISSQHDRLKHGAICNSLQKLECSVRYFHQLVELDPADTRHLSNLAMALSMSQKLEESLPYFKAYFASGGSGTDAMYWYATALSKLDFSEEACPWYYRVLASDPGDTKILSALMKELDKLGRGLEKKSLLAAFTAMNPKSKLQLPAIEPTNGMVYRTPSSVAVRMALDIRIPALDGRRFYVPVASVDEKREQVIEVNEVEVISTLSRSVIKDLNLKVAKIGDRRFRVEQMRVGRFLLKDFEVDVCESCTSKFNLKLFSQLNAHLDERGSVPFLVIGDDEA